MSGKDKRDVLDGATASMDPVAAVTQLLEFLRRNLELDLRVAAPAQVVSYNPTTQRAELLLGQLPVEYVEGEEVPLPPVPLPRVPVLWPRTATGYLTLPLAAGDTGLVVFADRALMKWLENPASGPVDPKNGRTHDAGDAVFFPGLHPDSAPITPPTSLTHTVLEGEMVALGVGATASAQPVARGTLLQTALNNYAAAITAANSALNTAAQTFYGFPAPTTAPQRATFASAWAAWNTATAAAQTTLATEITASLSEKVFVE